MTWSMDGDIKGIMKIATRIRPMEKMLGPDFELGLQQLKTAAESAT